MTRVVAISDTHGFQPALPEGDILIHAGDFSRFGYQSDAVECASYLASQPHETKIVIAGNHDVWCEEAGVEAVEDLFAKQGIIYLEDADVLVGGLHIYGTPWTPKFMDWAFNADPAMLRGLYRQIPSGLDILVTHGPPSEILDLTRDGIPAGSPELLTAVVRAKPKMHIFGHIHEGYGYRKVSSLPTDFYNVATCTRDYRPTNQPVVIDL